MSDEKPTTPEIEPRPAAELLPEVYTELRRLAHARVSALPAGQTLQATALVHEAYIRLERSGPGKWNHRGHFFVTAAEAVRRVLVERAPQKASLKRGGGWKRIDLQKLDIATDTDSDLLVALDEALERYAAKDPLGAELIKLRFFAGISSQKAAEMLGLAERTAKRTWAYARAWLYAELRKSLES